MKESNSQHSVCRANASHLLCKQIYSNLRSRSLRGKFVRFAHYRVFACSHRSHFIAKSRLRVSRSKTRGGFFSTARGGAQHYPAFCHGKPRTRTTFWRIFSSTPLPLPAEPSCSHHRHSPQVPLSRSNAP